LATQQAKAAIGTSASRQRIDTDERAVQPKRETAQAITPTGDAFRDSMGG
jgi:hypothetical protein